jgi:hypothetical protein
MQSAWGHLEAIASFERIARWHILCLRELQEETGFNSDMHIDSAELGRCKYPLKLLDQVHLECADGRLYKFTTSI